VALNLYKIRKAKGAAGDFFRKIAKQKPAQYQGLYVVSPAGKILGSNGKEPASRKDWPKVILDMIDDAISDFGKVTPRSSTTIDALVDRGLGVRKDGGITIAVSARLMLRGLEKSGLGEVTMDSVKLSGGDLKHLASPNAEAGDTWPVSAAVLKKFHVVLAPSSDSSMLATADEVAGGKLTAKVEKVTDGIAYIRYTGSIKGVHSYAFEPNKGKKINAEVGFTGVGTSDAKSGKLLTFTVLGYGTYRHYPPNNSPQKYGVVLEWKKRK